MNRIFRDIGNIKKRKKSRRRKYLKIFFRKRAFRNFIIAIPKKYITEKVYNEKIF